jgi:L-aspartate oxidase
VERIRHDGPLILGAGLAGLSAALAAAPRRALVISPTALGQGCASAWAQGGLAAALSEADSPEKHAADTLAAAAGIGDPLATAELTGDAPGAVRRLAGLGAPFDREADGRFTLNLEAAHSLARVARVGGDGAGAAIMQAVIAAARASGTVEFMEEARARALLQDAAGRVRGALVERNGRLVEIVAPITILATGGLGGLYQVTTDPAAVRGEGLGLAALAGAEIADPEFVQFHPTAMDLGLDPAPLASEAMRGEGAILVNHHGERFVDELAPRDVVARAVHAELTAGRGAFLDARKVIQDFPFALSACKAAGLDPFAQPIPIAPAAHYHMGGVAADADGRTSLPGLLAVGECASTGVHGANRLASNSLAEAAAFGARAGRLAAAAADAGTEPLPVQPFPDLPAGALQTLRRAMSRDAGVARDASGLLRLRALIAELEARHGRAPALIAAKLVALAALERRETRGAHARIDFPETAATAWRSRLTLQQAESRIQPAPMAAE